ncbi:hypothetical protein D9M72_580570 [compost metagenome]
MPSESPQTAEGSRMAQAVRMVSNSRRRDCSVSAAMASAGQTLSAATRMDAADIPSRMAASSARSGSNKSGLTKSIWRVRFET